MKNLFVFIPMLVLSVVSCGRRAVVKMHDYKEISAEVFQRIAVERDGACENFAVRFVPYSQCIPSEFDDPTGMWTLDRMKTSFKSFRLSELQGLNGNADAEIVRFNFLCLDTNEVEGYEFWFASAYVGDVNSADCLPPTGISNSIIYEFYHPFGSDIIYCIAPEE